MPFAGKLILVSILFSSTGGQVQLSCSSELAVFMCTDVSRSSLNWRIVTSSGIQKILSFNTHFDGDGLIRSKFIGSSSVRAELLHGNDTFVSASLVVDLTLFPMLSSISCNDDAISFNLNNNNYQPLLKIALHPVTQSSDFYGFRVTFVVPEGELDYYYVTVMPHPTSGSIYRTLSHQTSTLSLSNNVVYNVSISACHFMESTSHFVIGRCPFLPLVSANNVSYISSANGDETLLVRCVNGEEHFIDCARNGEWVNSTADICNNTLFDQASTRRVNETSIATMASLVTPECVVPSTTILTVTSIKNVYSVIMTHDKTESEQVSEGRVQKYGPIMAGILSGGFAFTIFIGITLFLLGVICGAKSKQKKMKMKEGDITNEAENNAVYEELNMNSVKLETMENIAYGKVTR